MIPLCRIICLLLIVPLVLSQPYLTNTIADAGLTSLYSTDQDSVTNVLAMSVGNLNSDGLSDIIFTGFDICSPTLESIYGLIKEGSKYSLKPMLLDSSYRYLFIPNLIDPTIDNLIAINPLGGTTFIIYNNEGNFNFTAIQTGTISTCNNHQVIFDITNSLFSFHTIFIYNRGFGSYNMYRLLSNNTIDPYNSMFVDPPGTWFSSQITFADLNFDGYLDMVLMGVNNSNSYFMTYPNLGNNTMGSVILQSNLTGIRDGSILPYDFDQDGYMDILYAGEYCIIPSCYPGTFYLRSMGNFTFMDLSSELSMPPAMHGDLELFQDEFGVINVAAVGFTGGAYGYIGIFNISSNGTIQTYTISNMSSTNSIRYNIFVYLSSSYGSVMIIFGATYVENKAFFSLSLDYELASLISNDFATFSQTRYLPVPYNYATTTLLDFDGDGCLDLHYQASTTLSQALSNVLLGNCNGTFRSNPYSWNMPPLYGSAVWADVNLDGVLEYIGIGKSRLFLYLSFPQNTFIILPTSHFYPQPFLEIPQDNYNVITLCELTGDLYPDIAIFDDSFGRGKIYQNLKNLSFSIMPVTGPSFNITQATTICLESRNVIGYQDMLVIVKRGGLPVRYTVPSVIYITSLPNNTITYTGIDEIPFWLSISLSVSSSKCLNNDWDCIVISYDSRIYPMYRTSNGSFVNSSYLSFDVFPTSPYTFWLDYDQDALPDFFQMGNQNTPIVFRNSGNGSFTNITSQVLPPSIASYYYGSVAMGKLDSQSNGISIFIMGRTDSICGPVLLTNVIPINTSTTSGIMEIDSSDNNNNNLIIILSSVLAGSGTIVLLLLLLCCIICCLCLLCGIIILLVVIVIVGFTALIIILLLALTGFMAGDAGLMVYILKRKPQSIDTIDEYEQDEPIPIEELEAMANEITEYKTIPWSEVTVIKKLGEGAFGQVLLCEWNGVEVAVKTFKEASPKAVEEFKHEALMMSKVSHHPNVVQLMGVCFYEQSMAMVMSLCTGGSLVSALEKKRLTLEDKNRIIKQTAGALVFLHSLGIVHRDIAARNVLLDGRNNAKLADLGMSRVMLNNQDEQTTSNDVGPIRWMAPESILKKVYSPASDCYAFAMMMVEVWSDGALPFIQINSLTEVALAVINEDVRPTIPDQVPLGQERLIVGLWRREPSERITMAKVVDFFNTSSSSTDTIAVPSRTDQSGSNYSPISLE